MTKVSIRQSQIAHTYAPGAIGDFPGVSVMFLSHDHEEYDWGKPEDELGDNAQVNKRRLINDRRLTEAFGIDSFVLPPLEGFGTNSVKVVRFPLSMYCPVCGRIHFANELEQYNHGLIPNTNGLTFDKGMRAYYCIDKNCRSAKSAKNNKGKAKINRTELVPTRFIIANEEGCIDDFPWDWYVHRRPDKRKYRGKGFKLYLEFGSSSASLGSITLISRNEEGKEIARCDLSQIFNQDLTFISEGDEYLQYVSNMIPRPWLGRLKSGWEMNVIDAPPVGEIQRSENGEVTGKCASVIKRKYPKTLQRGANNLFFPIVFKGIRLPEGVNNINQKLINSLTELKIQLQNSQPDNYQNFSNKDWVKHFKGSYNYIPSLQKYSKSEFDNAVSLLFPEEVIDEIIDKKQNLRFEEFTCYNDSNITLSKSIWYKARHINPLNDFLKDNVKIDKITLLDKINELKVFKGFTRIRPLVNEELIFETDKSKLKGALLDEYSRICDARKYPAKTNELPCTEVKGEGIFLKFSDKALVEWEKRPSVISRFDVMKANLSKYYETFGDENGLSSISARYVLLHTFSHMIMQQLANDSGYSLSSLSEIIYCNKPNEDKVMNGILLYTSTSDAEGTLGGLVEKGEPQRFALIISKAIDKAKWCSSDPLCITSNGQGFMTTNMAACYSCIMVPETCCENINKFLDRKLVLDYMNIESL